MSNEKTLLVNHAYLPDNSGNIISALSITKNEREPNDLLVNKQADTNCKHHSHEADELDLLCRKLSDVRVKNRNEFDNDNLNLASITGAQLKELIFMLKSEDENCSRASLIRFRKILANDNIQLHLDKVVKSGIISTFVQFLDGSDPELQFESAWILTNIAAGNSYHTSAVVDANCIPVLINLFQSSPFKDIKEQCIWCLGNIAGDSHLNRQEIIEKGGLVPLVDMIHLEMTEFMKSSTFVAEATMDFQMTRRKSHNYNLSTLRISIWALSNFCRGSGQSVELDWKLVGFAYPVLAEVIKCCSPPSDHTDDEILMDSCWALSRILRGIHEGIEEIIVEKSLLTHFGSLVCYENPDVQIPALRCLINIVSGCDQQTQYVVDAGLLDYLHSLLYGSHIAPTVKKEACLIVSNITAGTTSQIQAVIDCGLIPTLIRLLDDNDTKTQREAVWALSNALLNRDPNHVNHIVNQNIVNRFAKLLEAKTSCFHLTDQDEKMVIKILEAFKSILIVGEFFYKHQSLDIDQTQRLFENMRLESEIHNLTVQRENPYTSFFLDSNCVATEKIGRLASHKKACREIKGLAQEIIESWLLV